VTKMRKTLSALLILCLLFTLSLIGGFKVVVRAEFDPVLEVGSSSDYQTIQEAINNASSGDTILVHQGIYPENVVVNKSVSLIGEVRALTIIDGSLNGTVVQIRADNVSITGFTIRNSGSGSSDSGIFTDHSNWVNISGNTILNANYGIDLFYSNGNSILNNTISFNYNGGIVLSSSSYNLVSDNNISTSFLGLYGIQLYSSTYNVVTRNIAFSNFYGIYLSSASYNIVSGNNVFSNYQVGIDVTFSSFNNTVYHNSFDNTVNVQSEGDSSNTWSFEGEGNYWSDYTGRDPTEDGIGDTAYFINSLNQDNYPLMGRFSNFTVPLGNETFSVAIISNSTISNFKFEIGKETGNKIISYSVSGPNATSGFCRVSVPTKLMNDTYVVLVGNEEVIPKLLGLSNDTRICLYFTYLHQNQTVTLISSEALRLYYELFDRFVELQQQFYSLNASYYSLLNNFTILTGNFSQLEQSFDALNSAYQNLVGLNQSYYDLLSNFSLLQQNFTSLNLAYQIFYSLNASYYSLLNNFTTLLSDHSQLQERFDGLNSSYHEHLLDYDTQMQNMRNMLYILAAATAIFIIATIYLSKIAHSRTKTRIKVIGER